MSSPRIRLSSRWISSAGAAALVAVALLVALSRHAAGREPAQGSTTAPTTTTTTTTTTKDAHVVLITGANRGLGLEFAKQFCDAGWSVVATAREPDKAEELHALGERVRVLPLDVTDATSVASLAKALEKQPIDLLINNAGVGVAIEGGPKLDQLKIADFERVLQVNALGPVRVTQVLLPNLRAGRGKTVVAITSGLGSLTWNQQGGYYGYRESKAALDMFTRNIAAELKPEGFVCIALMPGWVKTDMGGPNATMTPEQSITAMRKVIEALKPADSGKLFNYDGTNPPW